MIEGQFFDGKYKIIKVLGKGGMSTVYLAENIKLGTFWAIKEISKKNSRIDTLIEPHILKKLNHPALPRIFDIIDDNDNLYIIVDYIEGTSLDLELESAGRFSEGTVIDWALQICDVLKYLHSFEPNPIIYRDMKPSNIILTIQGKLKLIDFGIAREYKHESGNDTVYIGTRGYAAPEQYGIGQTTVKSDIYSLGVTLYHLLTGKNPNEPPFEIKPVRTFDQSFSEDIESIISKCTKQNPDERYQSIDDLINDIKIKCIKESQPVNASQDNTQNQQTTKNGAVITRKKDVVVERTVLSFKKLILTVVGSSEFASELAYIASKTTGFKIMLVDLDFIKGNTDLNLDLVPQMEEILNCRQSTFGFSDLIAPSNKGHIELELLEKVSIKKQGLKNLNILLDKKNSVDIYDKYKNLNLVTLLDCIYKNFDLTIIVVSDCFFDHYSRIPLDRSDFNIIASRANINELRKYTSYIDFFHKTHGIPLEKFRYTAFEYKKDIDLNSNGIMNFFPQILGYISYADEREEARNIKSFYAKTAVTTHFEEYEKILIKLNMVMKKPFGKKLKNLFKK